MAFLDTPYKKKSTGITAVILIALLLMIFNFGMKYQDPPEEYGIAINFGTSNQGYEIPNDNLPAKEYLSLKNHPRTHCKLLIIY